MKRFLVNLYRKPTVLQAKEKADEEVGLRRRAVQTVIHKSFPEIDKALHVRADNGGASASGRSGYLSAKHFRRQRRYTDQEEAKITNKR